MDPGTATALASPPSSLQCIYPLAFTTQSPSPATQPYLQDPATRTLLEFFEAKGLRALKDEDRRELWYEDWLAFQKQHHLYATLLSPKQFSPANTTPGFDLLRYVRFLEVFAYCSPAHGYSLQVSFLGLFAILMGNNDSLKREAIARLHAGELLAFGISEKSHGSDLMANEFRITPAPPNSPTPWIANGDKYYIGNSNVASLITVLGRKEAATDARVARLPFMLVALRPQRSTPSWTNQKIPTLGIRSAHVGAFHVQNHPLAQSDIIAENRDAWDAVFGTVTLGKFFLGFGTLGICQHALHEAFSHLRQRILYGKPASHMPHLRSLMSQAYARLLAMKLYAYRTLDYVHSASPTDRRYQLFCAVQKAKVSTEGVKVTALLSECIGAKGFEADTYCEMALRDAALIPGLEGSMHINLGLAAQFLPRYLQHPTKAPPPPPSLLAGETPSRENPYLTSARTGGTQTIEFAWFLDAYRPFILLPNVALFARQAATFRRLARQLEAHHPDKSNTHISLALGHCLATLAYAQLIAENSHLLHIPPPLLSVIFSLLVTDLNTAALQLAAIPAFNNPYRSLIARMIKVPLTSAPDWTRLAEQFDA